MNISERRTLITLSAISKLSHATTLDIRNELGIGSTPVFSSFLAKSLAHSGFIKKKGAGKGAVWTLSKKGEQHLNENRNNLDANVGELFASSRVSQAEPTLSRTAGSAVDSIAKLIDENERMRGLLKRLYVEIGNELEAHKVSTEVV